MFRHMDVELDMVMDNSVPPMDLMKVTAFRTVILKHQRKAERLAGSDTNSLSQSVLFLCVFLSARQRRKSSKLTKGALGYEF